MNYSNALLLLGIQLIVSYVRGGSSESLVVNCSAWYQHTLRTFDSLRISTQISPTWQVDDFLLLQVHSFSHPVQLSTSSKNDNESVFYANGTDVGMVLLIGSQEQYLNWYLNSSTFAVKNFSVIFRVDHHPAHSPIPGGCNIDFNPTIAPQIETTIVDQVLLQVRFQPAGFVDRKGTQCIRPFTAAPFEYSVFLSLDPVYDLSFGTYLSSVRGMSFPDGILVNGYRVLNLPSKRHFKPVFYLPLHKTRGINIAIIVRNTEGAAEIASVESGSNSSVAYVTRVDHDCDITDPASCNNSYPVWSYFLFPAMLLLGFVSAFLGHHFFRFHLALYSFLCFGFLTILTIGNYTQFSLEKTAWFAVGVGCLGMLFMLWLWWFSGFPLPCVIPSSLVLGYLLSSTISAIPSIHLAYLLDLPSHGQEALFSVFCFVPLLFAYFARGLHVASTSVCGSYVALASLDIFFHTSRLSTIVWQSIIEQVFPDRSPLVLRTGAFSTTDIVCTVFLGIISSAGIIFQLQRSKGSSPFPPHRNLTKAVVDGRFEPAASRPEARPVRSGVQIVRPGEGAPRHEGVGVSEGAAPRQPAKPPLQSAKPPLQPAEPPLRRRDGVTNSTENLLGFRPRPSGSWLRRPDRPTSAYGSSIRGSSGS